MEAIACRVLLSEIVRRAAFDWVLYRNSRRLDNRELANDAYAWLFLEEPGHPGWVEKEKSGYILFSFVNICEVLDLDVDEVRKHLRKLTPRDIQTIGRPPTRRKGTPRLRGDQVESVSVDAGAAQSEVSALLAGGDLIDLV